MSQYDLSSVYEFLLHTPENGMRKVLVDPAGFSENHFRLAMKIVKNCSLEDFSQHFENEDFPRLKVGPAEMKIRDDFWRQFKSSLQSRGLLSLSETAQAPAAH